MKNTKDTADESYSSYWLDDSGYIFSDVGESDSPSLERIVKLAAVRRAISNFVRILTNDPTIEVKYSSGKQSFTDGKTVVISADDDTKNFDSMVGLALHEGSHCLLSDFTFLNAIQNELVFYNSLHPKLRKLIPIDMNSTSSSGYANDYAKIKTLQKYIHYLMNIVEDRRIDSYMYTMAPGYRPYYDALYNRYFFNKDTENNLRRNPEWRIPTVENYINWLVCMFSPHFNPRAMRGLTKMVRIIDLPNIRRFDKDGRMPPFGMWKITADGVYDYEHFPQVWKVANEVMIEILRQVHFEAKENNQPIQFGDITLEPSVGEHDDEMQNQNELENLDPVENGRFSEKRGKSALEKIKKTLSGEIKRKKLKRNEQNQIDSMEDASAKIVESNDKVFGKVPCLVTKELTKQILQSEWFPFARSWKNPKTNQIELNTDIFAEKGVLDGIRMGAILAQRLSVRNDENITHFTRQSHGKIDRRILAQLGMDIESVFKRTMVDQYNPAMLYLSLDASGSMSQNKWRKAISVATALAYASERIRNLDVVVSLRGNGIGAGIPCVSVVYDSRKDSFNKARKMFPHLMPTGSTPEGLCYIATMDLIQECISTHTTYFINFSDGEPGTSFNYNGRSFNYGGEQALIQTKNMVRLIREMGVKVMSYFISDKYYGTGSYGKAMFTRMYGQDAEFINVQNATQVLKTLNKLLLAKE
jgi:hypothetical protein